MFWKQSEDYRLEKQLERRIENQPKGLSASLQKNVIGSLPGLLEKVRETPQILPIVLLSLGFILWVISLQGVNLHLMTDVGLLAVLPATYYASLVILIISFCLAEFKIRSHPVVLALHLILLIFIFHGTPIILYGPDTMRYSWSWKHIGIIDYIMRHGSVNPFISFLSAYQNWPGFFALNALITQTAGLSSALSYARWAPVFDNLLFVGGLLLLYRSFTVDRRVIWLGAWFFVLSNWVGQDYFSPQATAYFLYLVAIAILLTWFRSTTRPNAQDLQRWLRSKRLAVWAERLYQHTTWDLPRQRANPQQRVMLIGIVIMIMAAITFIHQLTPIVLIGALVFLAILQIVYLPSLALLMIVFESIWLWFVAWPFMAQNLPSMIEGLGNLRGNVSQNLINLSNASAGQVIVSLMGRALTALMFGLGGIGFLRRLRTGSIDLPVLLLAAAPFPALVANSYGGEILFRVYFFALPALAFLTATIFYPQRFTQSSWLRMVAGVGLSCVILVGFLFAYYGKEKQYYISPQEVAATQYLFNTAPPGSLIISGTSDYPSLIKNYEYYTYVNISQEPKQSRQNILQDPAKVMTEWMSNTKYDGVFLIFTRSQAAAVDMIGTMPAGSLNYIEQSLIQSGKFVVLYQNEDAAIITLKDRAPR